MKASAKQKAIYDCRSTRIKDLEDACLKSATSLVHQYVGVFRGAASSLVVVLERTVPCNAFIDGLFCAFDRKPYDMREQDTELPNGYWSNILVFPVRESEGKVEYIVRDGYIVCADIPLVTVEPMHFGVIGRKQSYMFNDLNTELVAGLADMLEALKAADTFEYIEQDKAFSSEKRLRLVTKAALEERNQAI